ncbi:MAG: class I SAM-dependent RNA methyltransferase, partial [Brachymonas sp.]|nr:class I SAM-dependent RNA methyltransferase [Brachymonas sp.]
MNHLTLFLPCAGGVEPYLAQEAALILGRKDGIRAESAGVRIEASWREAMQLNLHSRLASRVLIQVQGCAYRSEQDIYQAACDVAWEIWFSQRQTFKIDITATRSPLKSLNFAALRVKDAICDRFRHLTGERPSVDVQRPDARIYVHLSADELSLYVDTSGEPLFKRGWRQDKGDAPLKETLAAAMLAASGWWNLEGEQRELQPLYDPCCGSGTIAIEAAQIALGIPAGGQRRFGFERLIPFQDHVWNAMKTIAFRADSMPANSQKGLKNLVIYGSDVAHRMADFAQRNAELAGVGAVIEFRGGDALQRKPPCPVPPQGAVILTNPPYGERIEVAGVAGVHSLPPRERAGVRASSGQLRPNRETAEFNAEEGDFFPQLATHWKTHFDGWTAHLLVPDMKLPG